MGLPEYVQRSYSGGAKALVLTAPLNADTLTFAATGSFTTWPSGATGPFTITVTAGLPTEEKMRMSGFVAETGIFTVQSTGSTTGRGYDGTAAVGHVPQVRTNPSQIRLTWSADEAREANHAVVQTVGKVTTAGDLLVGTGANALERLGKGSNGALLQATADSVDWLSLGSPGYIPKVTETGNEIEWITAAAAFGINSDTTTISSVNLEPRAAGASDLAARADHAHPMRFPVHNTGPIAGSIPDTNTFGWGFQVMTGNHDSDSEGHLRLDLPDAFDHCFAGVWLTVRALTTNNPQVTWAVLPTSASLTGCTLLFNYVSGGGVAEMATFGLFVLAAGC